MATMKSPARREASPSNPERPARGSSPGRERLGANAIDIISSARSRGSRTASKLPTAAGSLISDNPAGLSSQAARSPRSGGPAGAEPSNANRNREAEIGQ